MSFATPLILLGLLAIPLLIWWYAGQQRRRERAAAAFAAPALRASVAPVRPRWRRHAPMLAFALAAAILIAAAARPEHSVAVPVTDGAIMLADDVSSSMRSTDVAPSRLGAAQRAAARFLARVPTAVQVGLLEFSEKPILLQSPTTNHSLTANALKQLRASGHTAVGDAIHAALHSLTSLPKHGGKRPPSAIVLHLRRVLDRRQRSARRSPPGRLAAHPDLHRRGRHRPRDDPRPTGRADGQSAGAGRSAAAWRRSHASRAGAPSPRRTRAG